MVHRKEMCLYDFTKTVQQKEVSYFGHFSNQLILMWIRNKFSNK